MVQATLDGRFRSRRPQDLTSAAAKPKRVTSGRKSDVSRHEPESAGEVSSDDDAPLVYRNKLLLLLTSAAVADDDDSYDDAAIYKHVAISAARVIEVSHYPRTVRGISISSTALAYSAGAITRVLCCICRWHFIGIAIAKPRYVSHSGAAQPTNPARGADALLMVPGQLMLLLQNVDRTT